MNNKSIKERALLFLLLGLPIIAIIATMIYGKLTTDKSEQIPTNKGETQNNNPYAYDISNLKKVDPKLIRYSERKSGIKSPFLRPTAMTIAPDNTIYIAAKNRVQQLDLNGGKLQEFSVSGTPVSIDVADNGDIALCFEKEVLLLDKGRKKIFEAKPFPENALFTAVALEGDFLYVTDAGRRVLVQLDRLGKVVKGIGKRNVDAGIKGFIIPSPDFDVIPGRDETVWVVNPGRHQLENYTSDGKLRSSWSVEHTGIQGFSGCCNPTRIVLLENGDFVTAEKHIVRVKIYSPNGEFKCVVAPPKKFEDDAEIIDIAADRSGNIYILDSKNENIRVFEKKTD